MTEHINILTLVTWIGRHLSPNLVRHYRQQVLFQIEKVQVPMTLPLLNPKELRLTLY
jgi:hypothetical protein